MPVRRTYTPGGPGSRSVVDSEDNLWMNVSNNPGGNNPLGVVHLNIKGSLQNKRDAQGNVEYNLHPSSFYDRTYFVSLLGRESDAYYGTRLQAMTNPSRPNVLLPVFAAELRDIPSMVKEMGSVAIRARDKGFKRLFKEADTRTLAKANVAYQFGWAPFIQDLWKMITFTEAANKRLHELNRLREKGGIRRHMKNIEQRSQAGISYDELGPGAHVSFKKSISVKGTQIWKPTWPEYPQMSHSEIRRLVAGFSHHNIAANVWEAMPWSWFTDYFVNIGDLLQGGNRSVAYPDRGWVTIVAESSASHPGIFTRDGLYTLTPGTMTKKEIIRVPAYSGLTLSLPTLGTGQLSILGSLAVTKNYNVLSGRGPGS